MQSNEEIWKPVLGLEKDYLISESGQLKRISAARGTVPGYIFSPSISIKGYFITRLKYGGSYRKIYLHRLVCQAFHPNPENKPQVNHKDGDKKNNHFTNLEWVTNQENSTHAWDNNLMPEVGSYEREFWQRPSFHETN